jgi:hypothetical protein
MRNACWIHKATNTHSEHVILIAFPLQQWLHERVSMLRYTYSTERRNYFTNGIWNVAVLFGRNWQTFRTDHQRLPTKQKAISQFPQRPHKQKLPTPTCNFLGLASLLMLFYSYILWLNVSHLQGTTDIKTKSPTATPAPSVRNRRRAVNF